MRPRYQSGFTLLEAIVALVLLSTSGIALYAWLNASLLGLTRVDNVVELDQVVADLDAYFTTINLQQETSQVLEVNGYDVRWEAYLVEPKQMGRHGSGALGIHELGLFDVDVEVSRGGVEVGTYQTRVVGYKRVREPVSL